MNRIEAQAQYFRNIPLRDRNIKAVVHLEDKEDIPFWKHQLRCASPADYHFITYSQSENGINSTGCEQCLRYRPYLDRRFFICIDSDLRHLRGEEGLSAGNYVAQTYAYSWENHFCEAKRLQERFSALVPDCNFDFQIFLNNLSIAVYRPLLFLIKYSGSPELNRQWNISKFNACIPLQLNRNELADNGLPYVEKVSQKFEDALNGLTQLEPMTNEYINESNAYLHIQGHQLYKLVLHVGTMLCHGTGVAFKKDVLDRAIHSAGYWEIEGVQSDLAIITETE